MHVGTVVQNSIIRIDICKSTYWLSKACNCRKITMLAGVESILLADHLRGMSALPYSGVDFHMRNGKSTRTASKLPKNRFLNSGAIHYAMNTPTTAQGDSTNVYLEGLSEEQLMAVQSPRGAVHVVAGPGSGKTRVLTTRIAYLIGEHGAKPWEILAITFTNKAANEIKERLSGMMDSRHKNMDQVFAGTFHSLCYRILRRGIQKLPTIGVNQNWVVYDQDDSLALMAKIIRSKEAGAGVKGVELRSKAKQILGQISRIKNRLVTWHGLSAEEAVFKYFFDTRGYEISETEKESAKELVDWFQEYEIALKEANALDFDDLLGFTVALLRFDSDLLASLRKKYKYILIDEFQDTNTSQYEIAKLLSIGLQSQDSLADRSIESKEGSLSSNDIFVVGDPDQAIYGWRGAESSYMRNSFRQDFDGSRLYRLRDNYRSTLPILNAAQKVIKLIEDDERDEFNPKQGQGPNVEICKLEDAYHEAEYIADEIQNLIRNDMCRDRDIAVLVRTHAQTRPIEQRFVQKGIPYVLVGSVSFWRRTEIQDIMAYLRLAVTLNDDVALERIINTPKRGLGESSIKKLKLAAADKNMTLSAFLFGTNETSQLGNSDYLNDQLINEIADNEANPRDSVLDKRIHEVDFPELPCRKEIGLSPKAMASVEDFRKIIRKIRISVGNDKLDKAIEELIDSVNYKDHVAEGRCGVKNGDDVDERLERISRLIERAGSFVPGSDNFILEIEDMNHPNEMSALVEPQGRKENPNSQIGSPDLSSEDTAPRESNSVESIGHRIDDAIIIRDAVQKEVPNYKILRSLIRNAQDFLAEAALTSNADEGESFPGVRLMTMHSAKGLEFEAVFVPGTHYRYSAITSILIAIVCLVRI